METEEDELSICPYNPNHRIQLSRFRGHLLKCKDGYKVRHLYAICPYNSLHIIPKGEIEGHEFVCPDRKRHLSELAKLREVNACYQVQENKQPSICQVQSQDCPILNQNLKQEKTKAQESQSSSDEQSMLTLEDCTQCRDKLDDYLKRYHLGEDRIITLYNRYRALG